MNNSDLKIAISGTYSTGKSTTTEALALLTGIPRTYARTMRELLPVYIPGKILEQCTPFELFQLGLRRFNERAVNEAKEPRGYFTDGSSIHEYVYGLARLQTGMNPNASKFKQTASRIIMLPYKRVMEGIQDSFGQIVKSHAKENYDYFIHLPVEFPLTADGHRPFNESFRNLCDQLLLETIEELGIPYYVVKGSIEERLMQIVDIFHFKTVMSVEDAIEEAKIKVKIATKEKEKPMPVA
ncbi:ATP-binding protein [Bacillus sp. JJ634]